MSAQPFDTASHAVQAPATDAATVQPKTDDMPSAPAAEGLEQHPLSKLFPAMSDEEFLSLKDSIRSIGVQIPIILYEEMVADGWHRYVAASELGIPCPTVQLGDVDPREFVRAQNKTRRHLSASQRASIEVALCKWRPVGRPTNPAAAAGFPDALETTAEIAERAGVSMRTIEHAKAVEANCSDEVRAAVTSGDVSVERAAAVIKLPKDEQAAALRKPREKKSSRARQPIDGGSPKRPLASGSRAPEEKSAEEIEAAACEEAAFGDADLSRILAETQAELEAAQRQIAAMSADDLKAEAAKWQRISEVAKRRQNELQQAVTDREAELKRLMKIIRRVGKLVGEDDPSRVAAAVAAKLRCTEVSE